MLLAVNVANMNNRRINNEINKVDVYFGMDGLITEAHIGYFNRKQNKKNSVLKGGPSMFPELINS